MVILYISLYNTDSIERKNDIVNCLQNNLNNKYIDKIVVLNEGLEHSILNSEKVVQFSMCEQPSFSDFYSFLETDAINIIANSDIRFDSSLKYLKLLFLKKGDLLSLTRKEKNGIHLRINEGDSQDAWIFKGKPECLLNCDFKMGKLGCDSRLNFLFYEGGYRVLNPSKLISIFHEHTPPNTQHAESDRIKGPYLFTVPIGFFSFILHRILLYYFSKRRVNIFYSE